MARLECCNLFHAILNSKAKGKSESSHIHVYTHNPDTIPIIYTSNHTLPILQLRPPNLSNHNPLLSFLTPLPQHPPQYLPRRRLGNPLYKLHFR
jgi:hypothetical protein